MLRRSAVLLALAVPLAGADPANAGWFAGTDVGESGVARIGAVDLARDGTGGAVWARAGVVRFAAWARGRFSAPADVVSPGGAGAGTGAGTGAGDPVLAAGAGGALAAAWTAGGRVFAAYRPPGRRFFDPPVRVWDPPARTAPAGRPVVDLAGRRKGILAFSAGGDVHAVTLRSGVWHVLGGALDAVRARDAGTGTARPAVAMSSDGTALVAWGEAGAIEVRRVRGTRPSVAVAAAGLGDAPLLGTGDDDSLALVAWRRGTAEVARRLRGGVFDPAGAIAGGGDAALAVNGSGGGLLVATPPGGGPVAFGRVASELLTAPAALGAGVAPAAAAGSGSAFAAWIAGGQVQAGRRVAGGFEPATALGAADPGGGLAAAADAPGDALLAWVRGGRLVAGGYDRAPARPAGLTPRTWQPSARPLLRWRSVGDRFGVGYEVRIDGRAAGLASGTRLTPRRALPDGRHTWRVVAVDTRGQRATSRSAPLLVDTRAPALTLAFAGSRVRVRASDRGSGLAAMRVAWGDGSSSSGRVSSHAFAKSGTYVVRARARDRAGNLRTVRRSIRIE